jgi:HSP20 family protein
MRRLMMSRPPVGRYQRRAAVDFNGGRRLPLDVFSDEEGYTVLADVPGLEAADIEIELEQDVLTLKADRSGRDEGEHGSVWHERLHGARMRSLRLPEPVDRDAIQAWVENGVLTVRLPKSDEARPKKIAVTAR